MIFMSHNKYNNTKRVIDGINFDSLKEARRYQELLWLQKAGEIKDLKIHFPFVLQDGFITKRHEKIRPISYEADFYYYMPKEDCYVVEDVKGMRTDIYKLKRKMFLYKYPDILFKEL